MKKAILLRLKEEQKRKFQAICALEGKDMSEVLEELVGVWLEERKDWLRMPVASEGKAPKKKS